jgi:hypothetical protein
MSHPGGYLDARSEAELAQNMFDVYLDGALANHQPPGDFSIAQSASHQTAARPIAECAFDDDHALWPDSAPLPSWKTSPFCARKCAVSAGNAEKGRAALLLAG